MRLNLRGKTLAVLVVAALLACDGKSGSSRDGSASGSDGSASGIDAGRVPVNHRPSDAPCAMAPPPGNCSRSGPPPVDCTSDSNCTAGKSGRCLNPMGGPIRSCACTYETCTHDTDCASGQTCACHGSPYTAGVDNTCVKGNCRVDSDCGAAGFCSPSSFNYLCGDSLAGYYCHTAGDLCTDDSDCPAHVNVAGIPGCVYSTTNSRWECADLPVCL